MPETRQLSPEEIAIFRDCFNEYDQDRGGNISADEFGRVMRKTNPAIADDEVAKIIGEVDLDGDGTINFDEFITMMTGQPYTSPVPAAAAAAAAAAPAAESTTVVATGAAALRGLTTMTARLQRQRTANQVYKDAWTALDPSLEAVLSVAQAAQVAERVPGLSVTEVDLEELVGEGDEGVKYDKFLEFAKRQEGVDDILSGYE